jgi:hypothetical protein
MRRLLSFTTLFAILFSGLSAPVASANGCLLAQTGTVVTGRGTCTGAITIPAGVTEIGDFAFANTQITSITIPVSVTSIGTYAFFNTSFMETVTFNAESVLAIIGPKSFFNATALTSITIPASVTSIGDTAFFNNGSLASINVEPANTNYKEVGGVLFTKDGSKLLTYPLGKTGTSYIIPASVTVIRNSAFEYNSRLQSITFEAVSNLTTIEISAFGSNTSLTSITIPATVTSIGDNAFENTTSLTSISIPESVTTIGSRAFYYASLLTSITIPAGVTSIGSDAFSGASALTSINVSADNAVYKSIDGVVFSKNGATLLIYPSNKVGSSYTVPNGVTTIANNAFKLTAVSSITIPASVTTIGESAFSQATSLTTVTFATGSQLTSIGVSAFNSASSLANITIPESVTTISANAFNTTSSLTSITIPANVTSIGDYAFAAAALTSITFAAGSKITSISEGAFYVATSLTSITIPAGVTSIGNYAFNGASSLASVRFLSATAPTVGTTNAFSSIATGARAIVNDSATKASFPLVGGKWNSLSVLTVAEFEAELAAATFDSLIAALPAVDLITTSNTSAVASARSAYTALTSAAQALVVASLATLVAAEVKIASLTAPTSPIAPSAEELAAATRAAARVAELAQASARSDLAANSSSLFTVEKFVRAGISGITVKNLGEVSAEIAALPVERRSDLGEILKIARKFEVVDIVATSKRISASMLQEIGLIKSDNKNRSAITAALAKLPSSERASFAAIESAIATVMKTIQKRKDRLAAVQARLKR